jgi:hypothetical protein
LILPSRSDERTTRRQLVGFLLTWVISSLAILAGVEAEIRRFSQHKTLIFSFIAAFVLQLALYWLPGFAFPFRSFQSQLCSGQTLRPIGAIGEICCVHRLTFPVSAASLCRCRAISYLRLYPPIQIHQIRGGSYIQGFACWCNSLMTVRRFPS